MLMTETFLAVNYKEAYLGVSGGGWGKTAIFINIADLWLQLCSYK